MWHFLIYNLVWVIWLSYQDFPYCFLYLSVLEAIWVLFWTMKGIIWKFIAYFTLVIFNVTSYFFVKIYGPLSLNSNPYLQKNPGMLYIIGFEILSTFWMSNHHFPKKAMTSFNYALTLKKSLGTNFLLNSAYNLYKFQKNFWK